MTKGRRLSQCVSSTLGETKKVVYEAQIIPRNKVDFPSVFLFPFYFNQTTDFVPWSRSLIAMLSF